MKRVQFLLVALSAALSAFSAPAAEKGLPAKFSEAVKAGDLLVAEKTFRQMEEAKAKIDPVLVYQAAGVAQALGNSVGYRDRLIFFLGEEKKWTAEAAAAAWCLCEAGGGGAREYKRLAENVPADDRLYSCGLRMIDRFFDGKRGAEAVGVAAVALKTFGNDKTKRWEVLRRVYSRRRESHNIPGFPHAASDRLLIEYPCPDRIEQNEWLSWLDYATLVAYCEENLKDGICAPGDRFNKIDRLSDDKYYKEHPEELRKLDERIAKLKGPLRERRLGWQYYHVVLEAARRPENYYPGLKGAALKKAFLADVDAGGDIVDANGFGNWMWNAGRSGILKDADLPEVYGKHPTKFDVSKVSPVYGSLLDRGGQAAGDPFLVKIAEKDPYRALCLRKFNAHRLAAYDPELALRTVLAYARIDPEGYDRDSVYSLLEKTDAAKKPIYPLAKRAEFLVKLVKLCPCPWLWKRDTDARCLNRWKWLREPALKPYLDEVAAAQSRGIKSTDPLTELWMRIKVCNRGEGNLCDAKAHAVIDDLVKAYPGVYPGIGATWQEKQIIGNIMDRYYDLCRFNPESKCRYIEHAKPFYGAGSDWNRWNEMWRDCSRAKDIGGKWSWVGRVHEATAGGKPELMAVSHGSEMRKAYPKETDISKMSPGVLFAYIRQNVNTREPQKAGFSEELLVSTMCAYLSRCEEKGFDGGTLWQILDWFDGSEGLLKRKDSPYLKVFPFETLAKRYLDKDGGNWDVCHRLIGLSRLVGKDREYAARYAKMIAAMPNRFWRLRRALYAQRNIENSYEAFFGKDATAGAFLVKTVIPETVKAIPSEEASRLDFEMVGLSPLADLRNAVNRSGGETRKLYDDTVWMEFYRLFIHGARSVDNYMPHFLSAVAYDRAAAEKDAVAMARCAVTAGAWTRWDNEWGRARMRAARAAEQWQILYLFVGNMSEWSIREDIATEAGKYRAEAAAKLSGIYPVSEKDPAYPLYVAADELARNNSERAWELLQKAMTVFEREAIRLPPDFTAWALEQMRLARGKEDALLVSARRIATALLAQEQKIIPTLAAACLYTRAESFRDQQNFEAAKLEYQTIRNNPAYSSTPYGRKAMFRNVDLMIQMGNAAGAEQVIETWLSQPDVEVQTEAHYFSAKIAFDRQDYDECIRQLRKVFEADYTHTEGRFLHGRWKLATNNEVDETDVPVGSLSDRRIIRPGQQLAITVQDRNLAVAGGGASIPVVVTTAPGGDRESLLLYPSPRDPSLFRGTLDVKLAAAAPGSLALEVSGRDTVRYEIDPDFAVARGLGRKLPKELAIVDDAQLEVGTGGSGTDVVLRPGNPVYITVQDKDRSLGGAADEVGVTVKTTSGDILENVRLAETAPFTGVFRGQVPTALPPPRAFASDSAAGSNPGDVINSTRDGRWTSLADSKPGKWIEVDTMSSHVMSNATIRMRTPDEVRAIRLLGGLGGEARELGSLPAGKPEECAGLRLQEQVTWSLCRDENDMRVRFARGAKDAPASRAAGGLVWRGDFKNRREPRNVLFSGAFLRPDDSDFIRLRIHPLTASGVPLKSLWIAIALDGETVFSGSGEGVADRLVAFDCAVGVHRLEVFATVRAPEDDFEIQWAGADGEPSAFPMAVFDAKAHPEILGFLEDRAVITRTSWGFRADFRHPVRLRSIRWEFVACNSPDVQVSEITLTDVKGKRVLPVESDFSDARRNDTLEVAPGDLVWVSYADDATANGQKRVLSRSLRSSFNDAEVGFYCEEIGEGDGGAPRQQLFRAHRFRAGDSLVLSVTDPDCDRTPETDRVKVTVTANSGETREVELVEQSGRGQGEGVHGGVFLGLLRTCAATDTNANEKVMRVTPEDALTLRYEDRENTAPGVPTIRSAKIVGVRHTEPSLTLFDVRRERVVDTSAEARERLAAIRRRPGNEDVSALYADLLVGQPMPREVSGRTNGDIAVNVAAPLLLRVTDLCRACHDGSRVAVEAVSGTELSRAEAEGREPEVVRAELSVGGEFGRVRLTRGAMDVREAWREGVFQGSIGFRFGEDGAERALEEGRAKSLQVTGSDRVRIRVLGEDGRPVIERWLKLVSDGEIALMDSTWTAGRDQTHVGEKFCLRVTDPDRDLTDEADTIEVEARATRGGVRRKVALSETLPHSGVFQGAVRPVIFPKEERIPSLVTGAVASVEELLQEDRFAVGYGDDIVFTYNDPSTLPGTGTGLHSVTGSIHKGSDGAVRLFSKRFRSSDDAVLVQFRLAECLFEQAKEYRGLKQKEKSAAAIDEGKRCLEEAIRNYPDSVHAVQGEFLLANLYQELAAEQKDAGDVEAAKPLYTKALACFSAILATWPGSEFAPRAQYHKAMCLEMLQDYNRAAEEYVKMTYLYPESELVGDATVRLATYYYRNEKRYDVAAKIYANFARRFPNHAKAAQCLFMSGSCFIKMAEEIRKSRESEDADPARYRPSDREKELYRDAVAAFDAMNEGYREATKPALRAQALYWAGDASFRREDYPGAYLRLKRCVFEFPETEWARRARGLLLQEATAFEELGQ